MKILNIKLKFKLVTLVLFVLIGNVACAQSPGGVKNPVLWEKDWEANSQDEYGNKLFNYHPYKFFNEDRGYSELPLKDLKKMSLFVVFSSDNPTEIGRINTGTREVVLTDTSVVSKRSVPYKKISKPKFISFIESIPGENYTVQEVPNFLIGSKKIEDDWYEGGIAEVIMYDRLVSKKQRQKIESYLSLKYGISLPESSNYYASDGTVIRHGNKHGAFKNNVTGIGRDDQGGLYQKQARNLYSDIDLSMGLNALEDMNAYNKSELKDLNYLLWADNNGKPSFNKQTSESSEAAILDRKWELNLIGSAIKEIPVTIEIDPTSIENFDPKQRLSLIISDTEYPLHDDQSIKYEMQKTENGFKVSGVNLDENNSGKDYMTFIQGEIEEVKLDARNSASSDLLYPNPVGSGSEFSLELYDFEDSKLNVSILDAQGQVVRNQEINTTDYLMYQDRLKVAGTYMVFVKGENTNVKYKLIVQ